MSKSDRRPVGQTRDTGWQIGVRRTLPITHTEAWKLITSPAGLSVWLGNGADLHLSQGESYELADGATGEVRVLAPDSHLRITWLPKGVGWPGPSTIQVRVLPNGEKTVIAFHQEHLPGPEAREERRAFFDAALDELERISQAD